MRAGVAAGWVALVMRGSAQELVDGVGGGIGNGDVDGDLVQFFAVDGLDVESLEELLG